METPRGIPDTGERLEFVPWSSFERDGRTVPWRWVGLTAVAVLVASIAWWALVEADSQPPPAAAETEMVSPSLPPASAVVATTAAPQLSEADLRATQAWTTSSVLAAAESFVFGYFTIDPTRSTGDAAELAATLGDGGSSPTYVEWVRADEISDLGPERWEVLVRFRLITMGVHPERVEQAAVSVVVELDPAGLVIPAPPTLIEADRVRVEVGPISAFAELLIDGPGGIPVLGSAGQP